MRWLTGLFQNGVGGASLGRTAFWVVFAGANWTWLVKGVDIQHGHLITLLTLFGYILTGKFRGVAKTGGVEFDRDPAVPGGPPTAAPPPRSPKSPPTPPEGEAK